jgi:ethanolamine utilization protein EutL
MYGGAGCAQQKYAGEFIGMLSGPNPAEVKAGLAAAFDLLNADCTFYSANEDDTVAYYAYTISRTGSYLSECGGVPEGTPIAYLIAPPVEAQYALDAALKAADVRMCCYFEPPSETNFSGGYLTGTQSACKAACDAFADAVVFCVENALKY